MTVASGHRKRTRGEKQSERHFQLLNLLSCSTPYPYSVFFGQVAACRMIICQPLYLLNLNSSAARLCPSSIIHAFSAACLSMAAKREALGGGDQAIRLQHSTRYAWWFCPTHAQYRRRTFMGAPVLTRAFPVSKTTNAWETSASWGLNATRSAPTRGSCSPTWHGPSGAKGGCRKLATLA